MLGYGLQNKNNTKIKTCLIGRGYWGKIVEAKLKDLSELIFVVGADNDFTQITQHVDFAFVCSSVASHYDIVMKCIKNNIDVFCEKPFTGNYNMAVSLLDAADERNINVFVDNVFLFRDEIVDIMRSYNPDTITDMEFIWNKKYVGSEDVYDSWMYHDVYLMMALTGKMNSWKCIDKYNAGSVFSATLINGEVKVKFRYDRNFDGVEKKIIIGDEIIDLSVPQNDALYKLIKSVLIGKENKEYNNRMAINTLKILDGIRK